MFEKALITFEIVAILKLCETNQIVCILLSDKDAKKKAHTIPFVSYGRWLVSGLTKTSLFDGFSFFSHFSFFMGIWNILLNRYPYLGYKHFRNTGFLFRLNRYMYSILVMI